MERESLREITVRIGLERINIHEKITVKALLDSEVIELVISLSQIRYSLVVILELNDVSEVQYKDVMMIDDGKYQ